MSTKAEQKKQGYLRLMKSYVRQAIDVRKLSGIPIEPGWVLSLTDKILRDRQNQYLDNTGQPPPEIVTSIAGELFSEFKEIQTALNTGEISNPKIPKLIQNAEKRSRKAETKREGKISRLVSKGIPPEAAREAVEDEELKKIQPIANIVPVGESGEKPVQWSGPLPESGIPFPDFVGDRMQLTPGGIGYWNSYDAAEPFIEMRKDMGQPYQRFIIKLSDGQNRTISGSTAGTLKRVLSRLITKMNDFVSSFKPDDPGKPGSGDGFVEIAENENDLEINIEVFDDFEFDLYE